MQEPRHQSAGQREPLIRFPQSGSRLYQKGRVDLAETKYKRALDMARRAMMEMDAGDVDRRDAAMELGLACTLNLASCAIATKSFAQAVVSARGVTIVGLTLQESVRSDFSHFGDGWQWQGLVSPCYLETTIKGCVFPPKDPLTCRGVCNAAFLCIEVRALRLHAQEWCGHALSEDEQCAKGYLRRSKAHIGLADYDSAAKDIERARAALESLLGAGVCG